MHIKRVELENIKSYSEAVFDFERGTTAITGENGAGKTTIIEAIAWALFDLLSYKKDEFVRRGTKKGSVRVTFESGLDERDYTVYRDTGTGYNVYDPALNLRIADKKEDVTRFLWQHLGVEPGTDLETLFKHAIGVPQGTFTAIFLATAAERKKTFDTLLKVEEYRRSADELLRTARFVESRINQVSLALARSEGEIERIDSIAAERADIAGKIDQLRKDLDSLAASITGRANLVRSLDDVETAVNRLAVELEKLRAEKAKIELLKAERERELELSKQAAATVAEVKADADRHLGTFGRIKELEREREQRQKVRDGLAKIESAEARIGAEQQQMSSEIGRIQQSRSVIESLRPLVAEQEALEAETARLRTEVAASRAAADQIASIEDKLQRLRESYRKNQEEIKAADARRAHADALNGLLSRDAEIIRELANLNAALERDEAFQREVRSGLCPIFSERCLNLEDGQTLEGFLTSQFDEVKGKIAGLNAEQQKISAEIGVSRDADKLLSRLPTLEIRKAEIEEEGRRLNAEMGTISTAAGSLNERESALSKAEFELRKLDNPKTRISLFENDLKREGEIRRSLSAIEKNLERLESDRKIAVEQLEAYKDLDKHWHEATSLRDATADAYKTFIANVAAATLLAERERQFAGITEELSASAERLKTAETDYDAMDKGYDREKHRAERQALIDLEKRQVELKTTFEVASARERGLTADLERLEKIRRSMQDEYREKERLEQVAATTDFIRTTLKEAAPLVARNYVWHVSQEANLMFREITGNAERSLKWAEDYGITLEEGGYDRPFVSLSGGEQMAAALSVRLALLKQLSDIRIAFFDEPTTNMDAERRENLAQQISRIDTFDQLFVISHDDTFEGYMDNEITVQS